MIQAFDYEDVCEAYKRIKKHLDRTPLVQSVNLTDNDKNVFLKLENQQEVKSFKIRGALNKILTLTDTEKQRGVITVSSGSHGIATSYAAALTGIAQAFIIVPKNTPQNKIDKITFYGGEVMKVGNNYDEAHKEGMKIVREKGMTYIDPWDKDELVYAGQGTVAVEILEKNPDIDTMIVPIGGGGLVTGIAVAAKGIKKDIKIIGVQTEACPAYVHSIRDNTLYNEYQPKPSLCDALVGGIGHIAYKMHDVVDDVFIVSEDEIKEATTFAAIKEKQVIEPSSAVVIAAYLKNRQIIRGKNIALVISGGNADDLLFKTLIGQAS